MTEPMLGPNPFPGLRPFATEEAHVFFGREKEVTELLRRLDNHRVVLFVGQSGSGRASLVRAGVVPALRSLDWQVIYLRPGIDPVQNMVSALCFADPRLDAERVEMELQASRFGLRNTAPPEGTPRLFVVDQLEEIFRFRQRSMGSEDEIAEFLNLLSTAAADKSLRTYVLYLIRSEFLGECTRWPRLTEALNSGGVYLLPRLSRDGLRDVITGPVRTVGARITPSLVQRMINDTGEDPDSLLSLQYMLRRTWEVWSRLASAENPLDFPHYEQAGGPAESLDRGAEEAFRTLSSSEQELAKGVFVALVDASPGHPPVRRPATVAELAAVTGVHAAALVPVIQYFSSEEFPFLRTSSRTLNEDVIVDIAAEILVRRWRRLGNWLSEERSFVEKFERLQRFAEYCIPLRAADIREGLDLFNSAHRQ
jgi:hypothetical protein